MNTPLHQSQRAVVLGSLNMDLVTRTPRHPQIGETLIGQHFELTPGGKGRIKPLPVRAWGLIQPCSAVLGMTFFGDSLLQSLQSSSVHVGDIMRRPVSSGIAAITVDEQGQNTIIVVPGANADVGIDALERLETLLQSDSLLLMQLEIPLETVLKAADIAHRKGAVVILDPAPARDLPASLYPLIDVITPNQTEAALLVGQPVETIEDAQRAAHILIRRGVKHVIVKLGEMGVVYATQDTMITRPAFQVEVVDTVAAGDAFNGGLAAGLCAGLPFVEALKWASAAGALCVTRHGAQAAMPTRDELMAFLRSSNPTAS